MRHGARVANYSVEYQPPGGGPWRPLVPPVPKKPPKAAGGLGDRPDGHDPRDSHIGRKRIDLPVVPTGAGAVGKVRLLCLEAFESPVYLRGLSLHKKRVPWEEEA